MAWTASGLMGQSLMDMLANTTAMDLNSDTFNIALYNNSVTPDYSAAAAVVAYDTGQWVVANEVDDPADWPTGGVALAAVAFTIDQPAAGQFFFDSGNVSEVTTTIADIYGCLIYDDTIAAPVANQGLVAIMFAGAPYSTTAGTLTITVDANGWFYSDYTP